MSALQTRDGVRYRIRGWVGRVVLLVLVAFVAIPVTRTELPPREALHDRFPTHAPRVLHGAEPFVATGQGFAVPLSGDLAAAVAKRGGVSAVLPKRAEDGIRFHLLGGLDFRVRETGASGETMLAEGAVSYTRPGGTSFWTATDDGYEEWLHVNEGVATKREPVATWEIDGATLREVNGAVEVADVSGAGQVRVTAPAAFAQGERRVATRLAVNGARIELWVEAEGEPLLVDPVWTTIGSMTTARQGHAALLLNNGKVLVSGGSNSTGSLVGAELYDPATGLWSVTGSMNVARDQHTATLLSTGNVLVTGGYNGTTVLPSTEMYNATAGTWTLKASMTSPRGQHTATLVLSGTKVLVAGGHNGSVVTGTTELYDPVLNTWTPKVSMQTARRFHTATLLGSPLAGTVLFTGGFNSAYLSSAELYNPSANTCTLTSAMQTVRKSHTATALANGKVLVAGGYVGSGTAHLQSAQLYDPATQLWSAAGSMTAGRSQHTATLLQNGRVLVSGGLGGTPYLPSTEVYNPATNTWSSGGSMVAARASHTATLLQNGKVMIAGGYGGTGYLSSTEVYDPAMDEWGSTGSESTGRYQHTATRLSDGKVVVMGGYSGTSYPRIVERYDPSVGTWSNAGVLLTGRSRHTATLLSDGTILVAGGYAGSYVTNVELYNPATYISTAKTALLGARGLHTATLLVDGRVLLVGGRGVSSTNATVELYNPSGSGSPTWGPTMSTPRQSHTATRLSGGTVLVAGGSNGSTAIASSVVFQPSNNTWIGAAGSGSMSAARYSHTAALLSNDKVLVAGGTNGTSAMATAEIYDPSSGWSTTGPMAAARTDHAMTTLNTDWTLVTGGVGPSALASAEIYDSTTGTWLQAKSMSTARSYHTATALEDGKVLVAAGLGTGGVVLSTAELYTPVATTDGNLCTVDVWNATLGQVTHVPIDADDGNPCTDDGCDPATGVYHTFAGAGRLCLDGNQCNGAETCNGAGVCLPGTPIVSDDGNPCTTDSCNPATGVVTHTLVPGGTSCSDWDPCNGDEVCDASGVCLAGTPVNLDDGNVCTDDVCEIDWEDWPPTAYAVHLPVPGRACPDGNLCNGNETCNVYGACVAGTPVDVSDNNACTTDSCDPLTGLVTHALVNIDDDNECTADACDIMSGMITHPPVAEGTSCLPLGSCYGRPGCDGSGTCVCSQTDDLPEGDAEPCVHRGVENAPECTPRRPNPVPYAIFATRLVEIGEGASVTGNVNALGLGPNPPTYAVTVAANATVDPASWVFAPTAYLEAGAQVGALVTNTTTGSGAYTSIAPYTEPVSPPDIAPLVDTGRSVTVTTYEELPPASYAAVTVANGAMLVLTGGEYVFESLTVGEYASVHVDAASRVVAGSIDIGDGADIGPSATSGDLLNLLLISNVADGIDGSTAVRVRTDAEITGLIHAMKGTVEFYGSGLSGTITAMNAKVGDYATVSGVNAGKPYPVPTPCTYFKTYTYSGGAKIMPLRHV